jgi:hypothetical protein
MEDAEFKDPLDPEVDPDLHDPEDLDDELEVDLKGAKKKDLIDEDTVSLEDEIDEELDEDEEEPFDDVEEDDR